MAEKLVERGLVKEPLDLFDLSKDQLAVLNIGTDDEPRTFGAKHAAKVIEALDRARTLPLHRWIQALAIPEVGEQTSFDLAQFHGTLEDIAGSKLLHGVMEFQRFREQKLKAEADAVGQVLIDAGFAQLSKKKGSAPRDAVVVIGPVASAAILSWFASDAGRAVLARLAQFGITPRGATKAPSARARPVSGKTFVLTGTLATLARDEAATLIRAAGGNVTGAVTKNTSYLVAGESAGSKLGKARALGVPVLTEKEFLNLLNDSNLSPQEAKQGVLF